MYAIAAMAVALISFIFYLRAVCTLRTPRTPHALSNLTRPVWVRGNATLHSEPSENVRVLRATGIYGDRVRLTDTHYVGSCRAVRAACATSITRASSAVLLPASLRRPPARACILSRPSAPTPPPHFNYYYCVCVVLPASAVTTTVRSLRAL